MQGIYKSHVPIGLSMRVKYRKGWQRAGTHRWIQPSLAVGGEEEVEEIEGEVEGEEGEEEGKEESARKEEGRKEERGRRSVGE